MVDDNPFPFVGKQARLGTGRVLAPDGTWWTDPSEDLIYDLLSDCEHDGDFLIVERDETHWAQTAWKAGNPWVVEFRHGGPDAHFQTWVEDQSRVNNVLFGYLYDIDGWHDLAVWTKLEFDAGGVPIGEFDADGRPVEGT